MTKLISTMVLILILTIISGCTNFNRTETPSYQSETSSQVNQEVSPNELPLNNDHIKITTSDEIDGWKKLSVKDLLFKMTDYGDSTGYTQLEGDRIVEYSIHFPGSWTLEDTVFYDENNHKIAEIFPVISLGKGEESKFLDYKKSLEDSGEKLLSLEEISINGYKGSKAILQVNTENGIWYPNRYSLSDGTYGFIITMYSYSTKTDKDKEKLFNYIVKSFKFEL